jgi:hypothetical protein
VAEFYDAIPEVCRSLSGIARSTPATSRLSCTKPSDAQRRFTHQTPILSIANALTMMVVYGAIWSSSRGHHPYRGPSLGSIGVVYIMVAAIIVVSVTMYVRANAGISGPVDVWSASRRSH